MLLCLAAMGCGGPPAEVAGQYQGSSSVFITTGENQSASEFVQINQNGSEISFTLAGCPVKAYADSSSSFAVDGFTCTKFLTTKSWTIDITEGKVSGNAASINMNMKGRAKSGSLDEAVTFTFSGSKR